MHSKSSLVDFDDDRAIVKPDSASSYPNIMIRFVAGVVDDDGSSIHVVEGYAGAAEIGKRVRVATHVDELARSSSAASCSLRPPATHIVYKETPALERFKDGRRSRSSYP